MEKEELMKVFEGKLRRNEERGKTVLISEDTRRKCGQIVVVKRKCERGEERVDDNGMEREWREVREERPVKIEEEREEILLELRYGGREG